MSKTRQLALDFPNHPCFGKDDYLVAPCNVEAVQMIDRWPDWPFFAVCIYGSEGCGKTHLAHVFAGNVARITHDPYRLPLVQASRLRLEDIHDLFAQNRCLIVENLHRPFDQEAMFHLYNLYRNEGGNILFTSNEAPARLPLTLPDLRSRLNIVPSLEIKAPDDELLSALLIKLFADRQILPSPEIISYILANMQRSFAYARRLVAAIDRISLALKRAVTVPLVKEAIAELEQDQQGELFKEFY